LLDLIKTPDDLRRLDESQLRQVTDELRQETIDVVSVTGGHLGAGLGVVELTVALHYVFDTPRDRLIWDVGHQAYPHKILTGRRDRIRTLRQGGGLSGFTKRVESEYDPFGAAHSSTSISAALGMAVALPEEDTYSRSRGWIEDFIAICYGGWLAEKCFYEETTTGTKNDIQKATELARNMVCEWGMSEELGPITYGQEDEPIFLGKEIARHKDYSEDTAHRIDTAVRDILDKARECASKIINENKTKLENLADALLARETLIDDEVRQILGLPPAEKKKKKTEGAAR
jgi:hypothetical protein